MILLPILILYAGIAVWVGMAVLFGLAMKYQHHIGGKSPTAYIVTVTLISAIFWPVSLLLLKYTNLPDKL